MPFIVTAVTAVAGAISGILAAGGIGAALLRIGGTLLLSYAAQALMPKPQLTLQPRTVTIREPVVPRDLIYGRTRKGGVIIFLNSSGSDNKYLDLVIVLATHQIKSIGAVYFEGEVALDAAGVAQGLQHMHLDDIDAELADSVAPGQLLYLLLPVAAVMCALP